MDNPCGLLFRACAADDQNNRKEKIKKKIRSLSKLLKLGVQDIKSTYIVRLGACMREVLASLNLATI